MKRVEYSQIVRRKLKMLKVRLTAEFGTKVATKALKDITNAVRGLETFEEKGVSVSSMYDVGCDYRYLFVGHNYLFYKIFSVIKHFYDNNLVRLNPIKQIVVTDKQISVITFNIIHRGYRNTLFLKCF